MLAAGGVETGHGHSRRVRRQRIRTVSRNVYAPLERGVREGAHDAELASLHGRGEADGPPFGHLGDWVGYEAVLGMEGAVQEEADADPVHHRLPHKGEGRRLHRTVQGQPGRGQRRLHGPAREGALFEQKDTPRLTFGTQDLRDGMSLVPLLIGVFVVSEIVIQAERMGKEAVVDAGLADAHSRDRLTLAEVRRLVPLMMRSSLVGSVIGMMPGLGSSVACFVAYGEAKRRAPNREDWGTGVIEGIAAPESANNAVSGPSMIPLLTLGVPGSTVAAVLIGVFLIHGIQVGPLLFSDTNMIVTDAGDFFSSRELVFALFAAGLVGIAAYGILGFWGGPLIGKTIARVPPRYLYPFIFLTAVAASYSARASILDVAVALIFGVVGYGMRRTGLAPAAFVIAYVLARPMEESFRQALLLSDEGAMIFLREPVAGGFLLVGALVVALRLVATHRAARRAVA